MPRIRELTDEGRAELGIMTNWAVENCCAECGNVVDSTQDAYTEVSGAPYGRPDVDVMMHLDCQNRHAA